MTDFLKYRIPSFCLSTLFIAAGALAYFQHGGFRYSVDFTGGTQVLLKLSKEIGSEQLKGALGDAGWQDPLIREFGKKEVVIRVQEFSHDSQGLAQKMQTTLEATFTDTKVEILEANAVGPSVGKNLAKNFLLALLLSLLAMLMYIAFRFFSFSYGLGAVIAIFHDALAILALFALTQREISPNVICAIIATLGYSINDTIVIFSRMRENFVKMRGEVASTVVNISIAQTMRRTMLTSLSTALTVGSLLIWGGETLRNMSLALLVGIIVGTYSSVFIASPIMLMFRRKD
ncbi:protein translocase subunit SecF [Candidatus Babeliales bacterium]|nr:protein translocase subunit SecF [Candidatus Babeliales bacterium]